MTSPDRSAFMAMMPRRRSSFSEILSEEEKNDFVAAMMPRRRSSFGDLSEASATDLSTCVGLQDDASSRSGDEMDDLEIFSRLLQAPEIFLQLDEDNNEATVAPVFGFHIESNNIQYNKIASPYAADGGSMNMNMISDKNGTYHHVTGPVVTTQEASNFTRSHPQVSLGPPEKSTFYDSDDDSLSSHCEAVTTVLYDMFPDLLTAKEKSPNMTLLSSTGDGSMPFPPLLAAAAAALSSEKSLANASVSTSGTGGKNGENGGKPTRQRKARPSRHRPASTFPRPNVTLNVSVEADAVKSTLVKYSEGKAAMMMLKQQKEKNGNGDGNGERQYTTGSMGQYPNGKKVRRSSKRMDGADYRYGQQVNGNQVQQGQRDRSSASSSVSNSEDEGGGSSGSGGGGSGGDSNASSSKRPKILATISDSKENDDICVPADEFILPVKADDKVLVDSTTCHRATRVRNELHEMAKFPVRLFNAFNTGDMKTVYSVLDENLVEDCLLRTSSVERVLVGREYVKKMFHSMTCTHPDFVYLLRDARMIRAADGTRAIAVKLYFSGTRLDTRPSFNDEIFRKPGLNVAETLLDMSKMTSEEIEAAKRVGEKNRTEGSPYRIFGKVWYRYRLNEENKITEVFCVVTLKSLTEAKGMAVIATASSGGDVIMPST